MRVLVPVLAALVLAGIPGVASAAGVNDPIDTGAVATCRFKIIDHVFDPDYPYGETGVGLLRRIVVTPPTMTG